MTAIIRTFTKMKSRQLNKPQTSITCSDVRITVVTVRHHGLTGICGRTGINIMITVHSADNH